MIISRTIIIRTIIIRTIITELEQLLLIELYTIDYILDAID